MNKENSILGLIGIAAKAGKVICGTEAVEEAIKNKKAKLVIITEDASSKSIENMLFKCKKNDIPIVNYGTIEKISHAIGKINKSVICIKDNNLGEEIYKIISGGEAIG